MGENLKRCERSGATDDVMQLNFGKRRKLYCELENEYRDDLELPENAASLAASRTSGFCKLGDSAEVGRRSFRSPDLEDVDWQSEGCGMEISTSINGDFSREATPTRELCGDSEQVILMDSPSPSTRKSTSAPPRATPRRKISASVAKSTPSEAELDDFFAVAEKYVQKQFSEKYNYDIVKDVPLEGRYQWVRLHP